MEDKFENLRIGKVNTCRNLQLHLSILVLNLYHEEILFHLASNKKFFAKYNPKREEISKYLYARQARRVQRSATNLTLKAVDRPTS